MLSDVKSALAMKKAAVFRAAIHVNDLMPMSRRNILMCDVCC
jgi:hypothetical protein